MNIDLIIPTVPHEVFNISLDDADLTYDLRCKELWSEVCDEVLDNNYLSRSHHNVGTYDVGCRGPLCRKALREHPRRKRPTGTQFQLREERIYDPVLDYFHIIIKYRVRAAQQEILTNLKEMPA